MKIITDRPFTEYAKQVCAITEAICQQIQFESAVFYSGYADTINDFVLEWFSAASEPTIVIVLSDYVAHHNFALPLEKISSIPKTFIIVTEISNAKLDFPEYNNIHFINMGPTLLANQKPWERVLPQNFKDLTTGPHWISLNHNARPQRTLTATFLGHYDLGTNEENTGCLKINIDSHGARLPIQNFKEWFDWFLMFSKQRPEDITVPIYNKIKSGYEKLEQRREIHNNRGDFFPGYPKSLDNSRNFDKIIRKYYKTSVLEIVNETIYFSSGVGVSEKYLYTIMGFCFPIIISNVGTVAYLRSLGFDMFDDIINHHYDELPDPIWRAMYAIEDNLHLLSNADYARQQWLQCYHRFEKNYEFIKTKLPNLCLQQFTRDMLNLLLKLKESNT